MNIVVIGQCTLHWGRMEFGNIGNYYIIEPFFRYIHKVFPNSKVSTTFQMSDQFCRVEKIKRLPMSIYYGWGDDLIKAEKELKIAEDYLKTENISETTEYIEEVRKADLVIDFSGDIWGDNADFLGENRFIVGLIKDRVAQIFAKKCVMIAGSPGPFNKTKHLQFAKEVYKNFDLVTNRENYSIDILKNYNFDISKTYSLACPAFCFEPSPVSKIFDIKEIKNLFDKGRSVIGFLICGWNFPNGPFDKWPRNDEDYQVFVEAIEKFTDDKDVDIVLMSHSNGFPIPPRQFKLIHGRDYPIIKQLQKILNKRSKVNNLYTLDGIYDAWKTKAILSQFDMVVSGRVHAAVGAMSQCVPTVVIDYGHEPKAHKLKGFAEVAGQIKYLASPETPNDLLLKMNEAWRNKVEIEDDLNSKIPEVKKLAKKNFDLIKELFK